MNLRRFLSFLWMKPAWNYASAKNLRPHKRYVPCIQIQVEIWNLWTIHTFLCPVLFGFVWKSPWKSCFFRVTSWTPQNVMLKFHMTAAVVSVMLSQMQGLQWPHLCLPPLKPLDHHDPKVTTTLSGGIRRIFTPKNRRIHRAKTEARLSTFRPTWCWSQIITDQSKTSSKSISQEPWIMKETQTSRERIKVGAIQQIHIGIFTWQITSVFAIFHKCANSRLTANPNFDFQARLFFSNWKIDFSLENAEKKLLKRGVAMLC